MNWSIGASPACDLVVDEATVSSKHCEIIQTNGRLLLRDLQSTNGTWVNDQRISAETSISSADDIRLGSRTNLAWAKIQELAQCRVIRIGRETDNDFVVSDEKVSGHHARLLVNGKKLTLIDLESSNGTAVGTPTNKTARANVNADDDVYFASTRVRVGDMLSSAATVQAGAAPWKSAQFVWAAAAAALVGAITLFAVSRKGSDESPKVTPQAEVASAPAAVALSPEQQLEQSLFAVVVRSAETEPGLRVGTAWAVGDHKLATSGSVVMFLQQSTADFPHVLVQSVLDGRQWPVSRSFVHARCRENSNRMQRLGEQIEKHRQEFAALTEADFEGVSADSASESAVDESAIKDLTETILNLEDEWFLATETMIHFDVGLLETKESLARDGAAAQLAIASSPPSRLTAVELHGAAFFHNQSVVTEASKLPIVTQQCTAESFVKPEVDNIPRLVLTCRADHLEQNWLGAPVLNSAGEVVGLYSRPTPSLDPATPPTGERCDIVSATRLLDLLNQPE